MPGSLVCVGTGILLGGHLSPLAQNLIEQADVVGSTTALIKAVVTMPNQSFIVATDKRIFNKMKQLAPGKQLLEAPTEGDISDVAVKRTVAFSKYVAGGVDSLVPPRSYLTTIHKMTEEEVDAIENERTEYQKELEAEQEEEAQGG